MRSGEYPKLDDLDDGDLKFHTDFRSVYATLLDGWAWAPEHHRGAGPATGGDRGAPRTTSWKDEVDGEEAALHRKGATPARASEAMAGTPLAHYGEPVLVPGSSCARNFVMVGQGNAESMAGASHGAGRTLSRGEAMGGFDGEFRKFTAEFR